MGKSRERASLNLRIPPPLKARIEDYAARMGLSLNAAASVLLDRGLRAAQREMPARED